MGVWVDAGGGWEGLGVVWCGGWLFFLGRWMGGWAWVVRLRLRFKLREKLGRMDLTFIYRTNYSVGQGTF